MGHQSFVITVLLYVFSPDRDPVAIERSNLLSLTKLVVKELIESSLKFGRMLDSDHAPLQHFFILLEHVLRHGLKREQSLLFMPKTRGAMKGKLALARK